MLVGRSCGPRDRGFRANVQQGGAGGRKHDGLSLSLLVGARDKRPTGWGRGAEARRAFALASCRGSGLNSASRSSIVVKLPLKGSGSEAVVRGQA
jgi:hypothetical protein